MNHVEFNLNSRPDWKLQRGDEFFNQIVATWGQDTWMRVPDEQVGFAGVAGVQYRRPVADPERAT